MLTRRETKQTAVRLAAEAEAALEAAREDIRKAEALRTRAVDLLNLATYGGDSNFKPEG